MTRTHPTSVALLGASCELAQHLYEVWARLYAPDAEPDFRRLPPRLKDAYILIAQRALLALEVPRDSSSCSSASTPSEDVAGVNPVRQYGGDTGASFSAQLFSFAERQARHAFGCPKVIGSISPTEPYGVTEEPR